MLEEKDYEDFKADIDKLAVHVTKIKALENQIYAEERSYAKEYEKRLKQLKNTRPELTTLESKRRYAELMKRLKQVARTRLVTKPWPLWLYLGSANFYLPGEHRISYKVEYERTKTIGVLISICISLIQLLVESTILDAFSNFFLVYHYATMSLREHILVINGSNIRPWWIVHHYLSIAIAATLLIWPSGPSYYAIRKEIVCFGIYIAGVQLLQYRQQVNRLYTLRALSRVDPMETTTDAENLHHLTSDLLFLLPFLFLGHSFQFYMSYRFYCLGAATGFTEWQIGALSALFAAIASGNLTMTLLTVIRKAKNGGNNRNHSSKQIN